MREVSGAGLEYAHRKQVSVRLQKAIWTFFISLGCEELSLLRVRNAVQDVRSVSSFKVKLNHVQLRTG